MLMARGYREHLWPIASSWSWSGGGVRDTPCRGIRGVGGAAASCRVGDSGLEGDVRRQPRHPARRGMLAEAATQRINDGPLRLDACRAQLDGVAPRQDDGRPPEHQDACVLPGREDGCRQARERCLGRAARPVAEQQPRESGVFVVGEGVDAPADELHDLSRAREGDRSKHGGSRASQCDSGGAVLREESHQLALVNITRQARKNDAVGQRMAVQIQIRLDRPAFADWRTREAQGEAAEDLLQDLRAPRHQQDQQCLHRHDGTVGVDAERDPIADAQSHLSAVSPPQQHLALSEGQAKLLGIDAADGAGLRLRCHRHEARKLPYPPELLRLRHAIRVHAHAEADEVLLHECGRQEPAVPAPGRGRQRRDEATAALLGGQPRLGLRDVDVPAELRRGAFASDETEAAALVVRLDHAQVLLRIKRQLVLLLMQRIQGHC
mmetsp:Transcript_127821/g.409358  ORF Transcript_127821/g.409358 Transcript_127821/m.409358 type:complete len:437 (+) Transcript_127821:522-1832(+)